MKQNSSWKRICNAGDLGLILGLGKSPGEGNRLPTPVFWPGEFAESDATETFMSKKSTKPGEKYHACLIYFNSRIMKMLTKTNKLTNSFKYYVSGFSQPLEIQQGKS